MCICIDLETFSLKTWVCQFQNSKSRPKNVCWVELKREPSSLTQARDHSQARRKSLQACALLVSPLISSLKSVRHWYRRQFALPLPQAGMASSDLLLGFFQQCVLHCSIQTGKKYVLQKRDFIFVSKGTWNFSWRLFYRKTFFKTFLLSF